VKSLVVFILTTLVLAACGPRPQDCARVHVFCAGLVSASGGIDEGLNGQAWLGMLAARANGSVDRTDYIETVDPRDRLKNIASLAEAGYDVIVTVGFSIGAESRAAAGQFPDVRFIGIDQPQADAPANFTAVLFHEDRGGFLAGALAGMITRTRRVGAVCEEEFIDSVRRYCEGFRAGGLYVDPGLNLQIAYRNGPSENLFNDRDWGSATALQLVHSGADVLFAAGGGTAEAALEAGAAQGVYVIGTEYDLYTSGTVISPRLLSSSIKLVQPEVEELLGLAAAGGLDGTPAFGSMDLAPFHETDSLVPAEVAERLAVIRQGLESGSIRTEVPYNPP
jgi:basic membrane protein A